MKDTKYLHGGNVVRASRAYGLEPDSIIDFSANINPLGPPKAALDAITANHRLIARYPDPECVELRSSLARYLDLAPSHLVLGNGASELIHLVVGVMKPRKAGILIPTFSEYQHALDAAGCEAVYIPLFRDAGFLPDTEDLLRRLAGLDMLFVCNPNNPTGSVFRRESFLRILDAAEESGVFIVADEAFIDFVDDASEITLRRETTGRENLLVLGSLTKIFALPGLRVGYGISSPSFAERMWRAKDPWSVNALAQAASVACLGDTKFLAKTAKWLRSERAYLYGGLCKLPGVSPYPPSANYILAGIRDTGLAASDLCDSLGRKGILVRDCGNFPGLDEYHVRFAVKTREQNSVLLATLEDVL